MIRIPSLVLFCAVGTAGLACGNASEQNESSRAGGAGITASDDARGGSGNGKSSGGGTSSSTGSAQGGNANTSGSGNANTSGSGNADGSGDVGQAAAGASANAGGAAERGGNGGSTSAGRTGGASGAASGGVGNSASGGSTFGGGTSGGTGTLGGRSSATGGAATRGGAAGATSIGGNAASGNTGAAGATTVCNSFGTPSVVGTIQASGLTELSGLVASRDYANTLYAQADSGGAARISVFNEAGATLGVITLTGVTPTDWEDLAIGVIPDGTDYVYVADIGDNASRTGTGTPRTSISVYRFPEPASSSLSASSTVAVTDWQVARFAYPSATHDAETLFVDPRTQDMLIVTKDNSGQSIVYRAPNSAFASSATTTLEQVGQLTVGTSGATSAQIASGDISPTGDRVILRTYTAILLFPRLATWAQTFAATPVTLPSATEPQSEGLTFDSTGRAWLSAGEQSTSIHKGIAVCP